MTNPTELNAQPAADTAGQPRIRPRIRSSPKLREKLIQRGPESLEDAELLALLLGSGISGRPVLGIATGLLDQFAGISGVLAAPWEQVSAIPGIGSARFAAFQAARELARRSSIEPLGRQSIPTHSADLNRFLVGQLSSLPHEVFAVMFLDARRRLIRFEKLFFGSLTQTSVYPREVARRCLQLNAAAVIAVHNHPSGVAEPSRADLMLTTSLRRSLAALEIDLLDHLVVAGNRVVSAGEI